MRLRNRSHVQVLQAAGFVLSLLAGYRCSIWQDPEWTYLDVQPDPTGAHYEAFQHYLEATFVRLDRVSVPTALPRLFLVRPAEGAGDTKPWGLWATLFTLERLGANEVEVERVLNLQAGEEFSPATDHAYTVRRTR